MKIENIEKDDLEAWRKGPVGEAMKECLWALFGKQKELCLEAYWSGQPWSEGELRALQKYGILVEDLFEATIEDLRATMEIIDG